MDFALTLDLGKPVGTVREITLSTLSDARSWILHPDRVALEVSADGSTFHRAGETAASGDHQGEEIVRAHVWSGGSIPPDLSSGVRFLRFRVEGTKQLPAWHISAGGASWVFIDEIVVR